MSAHTPGPWEIDHDSTGLIVMAENRPVCIHSQQYRDSPLYSEEQAEEVPCDDEVLANGLLIVAAPDLLAALQACADYLDCIPESAAGGDDEALRLCKQARAAIARAEGHA